jgi:hypothetical protein
VTIQEHLPRHLSRQSYPQRSDTDHSGLSSTPSDLLFDLFGNPSDAQSHGPQQAVGRHRGAAVAGEAAAGRQQHQAPRRSANASNAANAAVELARTEEQHTSVALAK